MSGTWRFHIELTAETQPRITLIQGNTKGVWKLLADAAQDYFASREYGWIEGPDPKPCAYTAELEYRIIPEELPAPNNFIRVTVVDETRTVVEVKKTVQIVSY